jgi:hypothetical protein
MSCGHIDNYFKCNILSLIFEKVHNFMTIKEPQKCFAMVILFGGHDGFGSSLLLGFFLSRICHIRIQNKHHRACSRSLKKNLINYLVN